MMNVKTILLHNRFEKRLSWKLELLPFSSLFLDIAGEKGRRNEEKKKEIRSDSYRCCVEEEEFRESENFVASGLNYGTNAPSSKLSM